jgi:hypothetical protein
MLQTKFSDPPPQPNAPQPTAPQPEAPPPDPPPYNRSAIYDEAGPFDPSFVDEAVRTLLRTLPLNAAEPEYWSNRRMRSALTSLAALHPRDEIEIMLGVQALCAYHAAAACWHTGMKRSTATGDGTRHFATAANNARTFDAMLKAVERRQAKPLSVPAGRPDPQLWPIECVADILQTFEDRARRDRSRPESDTPESETPKAGTAETEKPAQPKPTRQATPDLEDIWTPEDLEIADQVFEQDRIDQENEGLDIANTEGILPGGGMIMPEHPTPEQEAYMGRRLALMYRREIEENLRKGITKYPKIRGIRPGDLIP